MPRDISTSPFASFGQAGYEGADHVDGRGRAVAMNAATGHDVECAADYARLAPFGIRAVRESVGWHVSERDGHFDFAEPVRRARRGAAARRRAVTRFPFAKSAGAVERLLRAPARRQRVSTGNTA